VPESEVQYFALGEGFRVAFEMDAAGKAVVMVVRFRGRRCARTGSSRAGSG
jgi:hypothetical protein